MTVPVLLTLDPYLATVTAFIAGITCGALIGVWWVAIRLARRMERILQAVREREEERRARRRLKAPMEGGLPPERQEASE